MTNYLSIDKQFKTQNKKQQKHLVSNKITVRELYFIKNLQSKLNKQNFTIAEESNTTNVNHNNKCNIRIANLKFLCLHATNVQFFQKS